MPPNKTRRDILANRRQGQRITMKHLSITILLGLSALIMFSANDVQASDRSGEPKIVTLRFTPLPVQPLRKALPNPHLKWAKTVKIQVTPGKREAAIQLYVDPNSRGIKNKNVQVQAFLADKRALYQLGVISAYGADDVKIQETDRQHNGSKQWELYGAWGAAADCLMIISFDREKNQWVSLVNESANLTEQLDLDGDGEKEIVTRFGAAADVTVYRWNTDHFELVDIAAALGNDYASKTQQGGKWIFESGKITNGEPHDRHFYEYRKGTLVEVSPPRH